MEKREEYLAIGVNEYWVADPALRHVIVLIRHAREHSAWAERLFMGDELITSQVVPGIAARVSDMWANIEFCGAADNPA